MNKQYFQVNVTMATPACKESCPNLQIDIEDLKYPADNVGDLYRLRQIRCVNAEYCQNLYKAFEEKRGSGYSMIETRVCKLKDGTEFIQREWETDFGSVFWCPEKSCAFCKKCEDIVYDGSGPYMFTCKKIDLTEAGYKGECPEFELDEKEMQRQDELSKTRVERREKLKETLQFMKDNPEVAEAFRKALFDTFMFGDGKGNGVIFDDQNREAHGAVQEAE